jgi:hypothetical protein
MKGVMVLSSTHVRGRRSARPADQCDSRPEPEPEVAILPYSFAAGLFAALVGGVVSLFVPGRGFLVVWAAVSLAVACAAGWGADRMHATAVRTLTRLSRAS